MIDLVAQIGVPGSLINWVIIAIVCAGVIGIGLVALRQSGITVPPFVVNIAWIVLVVVVAIAAIKLIVSML